MEDWESSGFGLRGLMFRVGKLQHVAASRLDGMDDAEIHKEEAILERAFQGIWA